MKTIRLKPSYNKMSPIYDLEEIAKYTGFQLWDTKRMRRKLDHTSDWTWRGEIADKCCDMMSDLDYYERNLLCRIKIYFLKYRKTKLTPLQQDAVKAEAEFHRELLFKNMDKL